MVEAVALVKAVREAQKVEKTVSGIYATYTANKNQENEKLDGAQRAVMKALSYTRFYLRKFNEGIRDHDKEFELMQLWFDAGAAMRQFNPKLSADFMFKSDHWADPDNPETQKKARKLDDILRNITEMIDPEREISPSEDEFISLRLNE